MSDEVQTTEQTVTEELKYTDSQLNNLIAKESGKRITAILKEFGLSSQEEIGEIITARDKLTTELAATLERAEKAEKKAVQRNLGRETVHQEYLKDDLTTLARALL